MASKSASSVPDSDTSEPRKEVKVRNSASRERRRVEILEAAAHLFAEQGYHATSIDDLVEATGLQRGGLYHYIEGKQDLLFQIHRLFVEPQLEELSKLAEADEPADVTLRAIVVELMRAFAAHRDQGFVFVYERRAMLDHPKWESVRSLRDQVEELIQKVIVRGVEEGQFNVPDSRIATQVLLGIINSSYEWFRTGGRYSADIVADRFADIFIDGIRA
jgi:TetR/AcrR family transcriptional regulator, cholesterol catabolism regulator